VLNILSSIFLFSFIPSILSLSLHVFNHLSPLSIPLSSIKPNKRTMSAQTREKKQLNKTIPS
jgi:hypothetical protein